MQFRVLGFPVTIQPAFVIVSLVGTTRDWKHGLEWLAVVLVSVLVHELGHAVAAARLTGASPRIELVGFGGLTSYSPAPGGADWRRRVAVALAGPVAGFGLGGLVWALACLSGTQETWLTKQLLWVNLGWGAVNLLPMAPLDGGSVLASLLERDRRGRGRLVVAVVSTLVACVLAWLAVRQLLPILALIAAYALIQNLDAIYQSYAQWRDRKYAPSLDQIWQKIHSGGAAVATGELRRLLGSLRCKAARARSVEMLVWSHLQLGDLDGARTALLCMPAEYSASSELQERLRREQESPEEQYPFPWRPLYALLTAAVGEAQRRSHQKVGVNHVLWALLRADEPLALLCACGLDAAALETAVVARLDGMAADPGNPVPELPAWDELLERQVRAAYELVGNCGRQQVRIADLLATLVMADGADESARLLAGAGVTRLALLRRISHGDTDWTPPDVRFPEGRAAIVLHNDDYTTMEFVLTVLTERFALDAEQAREVMMRIHSAGSARVGEYDEQQAHALAGALRSCAESAGFPLLCTVEACAAKLPEGNRVY